MAIEAFDLFFIARCGVLSSLDWTWWPALVADWIQLHNNRGDLSLKMILFFWLLLVLENRTTSIALNLLLHPRLWHSFFADTSVEG